MNPETPFLLLFRNFLFLLLRFSLIMLSTDRISRKRETLQDTEGREKESSGKTDSKRDPLKEYLCGKCPEGALGKNTLPQELR